ncbi:MAG: MATE family efflux transporter [Archaeoglobaceae archaeon]|nr:MATE family efflux transporter [Archaeoglobaceae archaeon]MDW8118244.1 MATE family efflux transporter [Archaeoglobaceae archaeon]
MSESKEIRMLTGDPKNALIRLSIPMIIQNTVFTLYNIADGIWVAGLGHEALAAVGLFFPVFMLFNALAFGLSIGSNSAVARRIGAKDLHSARVVAMHSFLIGIVISLIILSSLFYLRTILTILGAEGEVLRLSYEYGSIMIAGSVFLVYTNVSAGLMNGEGNAKRSMYANAFGSILNVLLDPIFIYTFSLGVAGAALASVLCLAISTIIFIYWFQSGKSSLKPKRNRWSWKIVFDLLRVGIPASFGMIAMSISMMLINRIVLTVGGDHSLAVYSAVWRLILIGFIPLFGIAGALTAVSGASYGAKNAEKIRSAHRSALKFALAVNILILGLMLLFAPQFAFVFAYTEKGILIYDGVVDSLRVMAFILICASIGITSTSIFQGIGKGERALVLTLTRVSMQVLVAYTLAIPASLGFTGVLFGMVLGDAFAAILSYLWVNATIRSLFRSFESVKLHIDLRGD